MPFSDLHTHTVFSDGRNTIEEMVLAAIGKNMVSIGISDHSYTEFDLRYCMKKEMEDAYVQEIRRVKEKYKDQIQVYVGLEYDGYSELDNREEFDYLIGDCHYIKTWDGFHSVDHAKDEQWQAIETYFNGDAMAYARAYYETCVDRTRAHCPDILGHFDVVVKHNHIDETSSAYRNMAVDAMVACLEITPVVEMNTGSITRKWRDTAFPDTYLLKEVCAHGGRVILSSDSHGTDTLTGGFRDAKEILRTAGFRSMLVFRDGQFQETGL